MLKYFRDLVALSLIVMTYSSCGRESSDTTSGNSSTTSSSSSNCSLSTTWNTIDSYRYLTGSSAEAKGFAQDSGGNIYVVGRANNSGWRYIVRKSTDQGSTWTTVDDFVRSGGTSSEGSAILFVSGTLYTVGNGSDGTSTRYIVRKSTDSGSNWTTVDDFVYSGGTNSRAIAIVADPSGNIYTAGSGNDGVNTRYIVRKSTDGGSSWTTVDDFLRAGGTNSVANGLLSDSSGNIYSVGYGSDASFNNFWIVRKSTDGGSNWSTVDEFNYTGGTSSIANAIARDSSGNLFVVGRGRDSSNTNFVVRKSTDAGSTWTTSDSYLVSGGNNSGGNAIAIGSNGTIFTSGYGGNGSAWVFITRKSTDSGSTWSTSDSFIYSGGTDSTGFGIGFSSNGSVYALGKGSDGSTTYWVIRKLSCE